MTLKEEILALSHLVYLQKKLMKEAEESSYTTEDWDRMIEHANEICLMFQKDTYKGITLSAEFKAFSKKCILDEMIEIEKISILATKTLDKMEQEELDPQSSSKKAA